jgi:prepilin-type N-terminal cleavage/methylation domain-containing protein
MTKKDSTSKDLTGSEKKTTRKDMTRKSQTCGFTLLELMVSMAVGLVVIAAGAQLFNQALKGTWMTSQKAEMQSDFRASANLMTRDIGMAGAGSLGNQGLAASSVLLPTGSGVLPSVYPCSTTTCNYINGAPVTYPTASCGGRCLYSIIPGYNVGITVNAAQGPTDIITVVYADANLASSCYTITAKTNTTVNFELPAVVPPATLPPNCIVQSGLTAPQALNDPVVGLQAGDVILFDQAAIAVVTNIATCAPTGTNTACYTATFNNSDPGHINQPSATSGDLANYTPTLGTSSATRLLVITYYLDISPTDGVTPRLMRIQNGKSPAPVAENVAYLKFSYDVNNNGTVNANQTSLPTGTNPSMITKVNILHMAMRSQLSGSTGYQGLDLQTSVAARDMTFKNEYPVQ